MNRSIRDIYNNLLWLSDEKECHKWEDQINYRNTYPVICRHNIVPTQNIYPLKQRVAVSIHDEFKNDPRINNIILFGSSVSMRCTKDSDTDLSIRLMPEYTGNDTKNEISERIQEICNWNADIIWFDRISPNERIFHNILKGVQIL